MTFRAFRALPFLLQRHHLQHLKSRQALETNSDNDEEYNREEVGEEEDREEGGEEEGEDSGKKAKNQSMEDEKTKENEKDGALISVTGRLQWLSTKGYRKLALAGKTTNQAACIFI